MTRTLVLPTLAILAACGAPKTHPVVDEPVACEVPGLGNCRQSGDVVFGGQPTQASLQFLADQGYTTVVSARGLTEVDWDERAAVESLGMRFVQIPMANPVTRITDAQIAALDSVLQEQSGPVLLHCGSGNRVAGLWAAWLTEKRGVPPDSALRLAALAGMAGVRVVVEQRLAACKYC